MVGSPPIIFLDEPTSGTIFHVSSFQLSIDLYEVFLPSFKISIFQASIPLADVSCGKW